MIDFFNDSACMHLRIGNISTHVEGFNFRNMNLSCLFMYMSSYDLSSSNKVSLRQNSSNVALNYHWVKNFSSVTPIKLGGLLHLDQTCSQLCVTDDSNNKQQKTARAKCLINSLIITS